MRAPQAQVHVVPQGRHTMSEWSVPLENARDLAHDTSHWN